MKAPEDPVGPDTDLLMIKPVSVTLCVWWVPFGISYAKVQCDGCYTAYRTVRYCVWLLYGISYGKVLCGGCYTAYRTVRYCVVGVIWHIVR